MAATLRIDTLKFAKRLAQAGLSQEAAEAIVEGLSDADLSELATKSDIGELRAATKSDIDELKAATKSDIGELRAATKSDIDELRAATKSDIGELKAAISELKVAISDLRADIYSRLWIMGLGIVGLTVALIKVLPA